MGEAFYFWDGVEQVADGVSACGCLIDGFYDERQFHFVEESGDDCVSGLLECHSFCLVRLDWRVAAFYGTHALFE